MEEAERKVRLKDKSLCKLMGLQLAKARTKVCVNRPALKVMCSALFLFLVTPQPALASLCMFDL